MARSPTVLFNEKMLAGLGRGIVSTGKLDPEAVTRVDGGIPPLPRAVRPGRRRAAVCASPPPPPARPRTARISSIAPRTILGTEIRVLSGREEAHYSALGVISGFHPANGIAGDLGGGSLELVDVNGEAIGDGITLPLGGLRLQDMAKSSLAPAARDRARASWPAAKLLKGGQGRAFYAVGGTWRNLARLHMNVTNYPLGVMHHYEIGIESSANFLARSARGEIEKIKGIERRLEEPPRAAALWRDRAAGNHRGDAAVEDRRLGARRARRLPLFAAVARGATRRSADLGLGGAGAAARPFGHPCPRARRMDRRRPSPPSASTRPRTRCAIASAACLLADIGWRAHPEYRGTQSLNIIAHASFIGVDHPGRAFIALANLYRHEGVFNEAPRRRSEGAGDAALSRAGPRARRDDARRLPAVGRRCRASCRRLRWESRGNGVLALVIPASHGRSLRRAAGRPTGATGEDHQPPAGAGGRGRPEHLGQVTANGSRCRSGNLGPDAECAAVDRPGAGAGHRQRQESRRQSRCPSSASARAGRSASGRRRPGRSGR